MAEFSYRYNPETGRWDVITRRPGGTVEVLHKVSFDTSDAAMNHVALLTGKREREICKGAAPDGKGRPRRSARISTGAIASPGCFGVDGLGERRLTL